jgi:dipeptidyl aminopeptidase/acylaminoacyl peptidase
MRFTKAEPKHMRPARVAITVAIAAPLLLPAPSAAQGTVADYQRAMGLREKYQGLAVGTVDGPRFMEKTNRFYYRRTTRDGHEFVMIEPSTQARMPAFDHAKLASGLSAALNRRLTANGLPFATFTFADGAKAIEFNLQDGPGPAPQGLAQGTAWRCTLADYRCQPQQGAGRGGRGGRGGGGLTGPVRPPFEINGGEPKKSPDGRFEALVSNYNVALRQTGRRELTLLSSDGSEGAYYDLDSLAWSPDSRKFAVYKVRPGFRRFVHYVASSPEDQLQPQHSTMQYAKPGDVLDVEMPVIFHVDRRAQILVDSTLFPNAYDMSRLEWRKDSRAVTFEYNERGHRVFRVIEVASDGTPRAVVSEEPKTFFAYSSKKFRHDVADGQEIVWMSERDGWNHLYLFDGVTGALKNQITRGDWPVRSVVKVDEDTRQIWFSASGMSPQSDPYFVHYYRINFDGAGLTPLTTVAANHSATFSPDMTLYVDSYSRVDLPPVTELRRTADASVVMTLEKTDIAALERAGWKAPEVFVAKGRDGRTDIWGVIYRPSNFDPAKPYPVVENIYAGPHAAFVPKSFASFNQMQALAEIGIIVVQIDGMGTNFRSKAFHDVAWQNLKDAGFPDRILWHKAVAAKYPYYDITRVGIYGTSAGGQSSLGGLLFHPDFYKAAVSSVGCHDNRMDKIWWNEQWMGWPIKPHYAQSSNVENAHLLQGKVLLIVGELDRNVDPSSTMQVVNQLIKHNKDFELLVIPGAGHGPGGAYGDHKRFDFFTRHLLGVTPPEWKALEDAERKRTSTASASR